MDKIQQLFDEHQTDPLVQDILLQQHLSYEAHFANTKSQVSF